MTQANDTHPGSQRARATHQSVGTLEGNPLGVIVGGLALGAIVAAIIPRSQREKDLLAPIGKRVNATATAAIAAAKNAGRAELGELGLSRTAAKDQVRSVFEGLSKAAATAGSAAAQAGKDAIKTA